MRYKLSPFPIVTYAASPPKKTAPFSKTSGCQLPATFKRTRFPAAAHLVCDEDQQLTAEALEAARIAVNKCPTRPTSRDEWEGTKREVTGGWCLVDVIDGEGYLLITNQLLLICNKLETPTTRGWESVPKRDGVRWRWQMVPISVSSCWLLHHKVCLSSIEMMIGKDDHPPWW